MTKLYIFDADGTQCDRDTGELLPNTLETIQALPADAKLAIVTNQGGVGLRYWMVTQGFGEPSKFPTEGEVYSQYTSVSAAISGTQPCPVYFSFAYQCKKSGEWGPTPEDYKRLHAAMAWGEPRPEWSQAWRKPAPGMLLQAMKDAGVTASNAVMIGDRDEDEQAAIAAGVEFIHADEFFARKGAADE